ncbi:MAG: nucleotidyltransferase family protein, partial [Deltaproteobacteria bacterium]
MTYVAATAHSFPNEGEFRLFPLVAHQMGDTADAEASIWLSEATGWATSRRRQIAAAIDYVTPILLENQIPLIWTKGTALAATVYPSPNLRPSGDLDGLLHWDHLPRLAALAEKLGWTSYLGQQGPAAGHRYRGSELSWKLPGGIALDVGWMPRRTFAFDPFVIEYVVANARRAPDQLAVADTTWLFIEAIEHGLSANPVWPIRWVVDALRLIEISGAQIDWEFIVDIAQRYKMQSLMLLGLETLSAFTNEIPDMVIAALSRHQPTRLERDELSARLNLATVKDNFLVVQRYNVVQRAPL